MKFKLWFACWRRGYHRWRLAWNLYGDAINVFNARSLWVCCDCSRHYWGKYLGPEDAPHARLWNEKRASPAQEKPK